MMRDNGLVALCTSIQALPLAAGLAVADLRPPDGVARAGRGWPAATGWRCQGGPWLTCGHRMAVLGRAVADLRPPDGGARAGRGGDLQMEGIAVDCNYGG